MFDIILCLSQNNGLGLNNQLPWNIPLELKIFKEKTYHNILFVGRNTLKSLPYIKNRIFFCITSDIDNIIDTKNSVLYFNNIETALETAKTEFPNLKYFIIGGKKLYTTIFNNYSYLINNIHISRLNDPYICDTYFDKIDEYLINFKIYSSTQYDNFTHYIYTKKYENIGEKQYLNLLENILENGIERKGRNGITKSLFVNHLKFDLRDGFPLLTTKLMFTKGIIEELLFFIRGDTDTKILENKGINIWKGNTNRTFLDNLKFYNRPEGIMGPMYGYNFRFFNSLYDEKTGKPLTSGFDQLKHVINLIENEPNSRRILLTSYNPSVVNDGVLPPCHSISVQFVIENKYIDMFCFNRSADMFLGVPFNIASSSLLLILIGKLTNYISRFFHLTLGDTHIYKEHYECVKEQIQRIPYKFPTITINKDIQTIADVEKMSYQDFKINNYKSHSKIVGIMKE